MFGKSIEQSRITLSMVAKMLERTRANQKRPASKSHPQVPGRQLGSTQEAQC